MKSDVVIIGGAPGGATCAMSLAEHGIQSTIVDRAPFPRYQIGESMTGECGGIVRALRLEEKMLQDKHPHKHAVSVYGTEARTSWQVEVKGRSPEGELYETFTWQVRRSAFDSMMLDSAVDRGATLVQGTADSVIWDDDTVRGVQVRVPDGQMEDIEAEVLVDASGYSTFLHNVGATGRKTPGK